MKQLQKRSKFEEIVNNKPIKIITKPDYTDVSNDFHISNIRDFDYDIEKQILDNKKQLIQSDLLNEITTRMQRQDEKIKNVLDKTDKEIQTNLTEYIDLNSDNNKEVETEDIYSQENIDNAMKLAEKEAAIKAKEEEATKDSTTTKPLNIKSSHFDKKRRKGRGFSTRPVAKDSVDTIPEIKPTITDTGHSFYGSIKTQKTQQGPYSPTNKGKSQANDESMVKQMEVDAPTEKAEGMNIDTSGVKRVADDTKEEILKRAKQGEFIPNFKRILNVATKAMIQQQMIMQGIPFDETHKKSVLKDRLRYSKWTDAVEENTIKKRLEEYKAEHGFLPLENVQDTASSSKQGEKRPAESSKNEPKAKAKSQAASSSSEPKAKSKAASSSSEPKAQSKAASSSSEPKAKSQAASSSSEPKAKSQAASSSGDPKPKAKLTLPKGELLEEEDEPDIRRYQQSPILSPKRASKNIGVLTENLKTASQRGLITGADLVLYNTLGTVKEIKKIKNKAEKQRVMDNLTMLYKKYVYDPSLISFNLSPKGVKKTIQKEK